MRAVRLIAVWVLIMLCACSRGTIASYGFQPQYDFLEKGFDAETVKPFVFDETFVGAMIVRDETETGRIRYNCYKMYVNFYSKGPREPIYVETIKLTSGGEILNKTFNQELEFVRQFDKYMKPPTFVAFSGIPKSFFDKKTGEVQVDIVVRFGGATYTISLILVKETLGIPIH